MSATTALEESAYDATNDKYQREAMTNVKQCLYIFGKHSMMEGMNIVTSCKPRMLRK